MALAIPWVGSRYDTFLATQIAISALFAVSLNLLLGTTGLVSFGHVAYFGIGAYVCGILMKTYGVPFASRCRPRRSAPALGALVFGFFCVRLTRIYFAMLTLAFSQIVWAICFKWNDVTGGDQGLPDVPYPDLDWMSAIPAARRLRIGDQFYLLTLVVVMLSLAALRRIIALAVRPDVDDDPGEPRARRLLSASMCARYELAAFVVAGGFAGIAGALFGIFNRGVFADYVFWPKSAEVMIMTILGGIELFLGPGGRRGGARCCSTRRSPPTPNTGRSCWAPSWSCCCSPSPAASSAASPPGCLASPRVRRRLAMLEMRGSEQIVRAASRRSATSA